MSLYVPLWCKSNFSFLEGASHPDELVDEASRFGLPALALTDRDGVYGIVRAYVKAREVGLKIIVGSEMTIADGSTIVLLAQDRAGYANLCRLISKGRLRSEKGESSVSWEQVCGHAPGLIALWGGTYGDLDSGFRRNDAKRQSLRDGRSLSVHDVNFDDITSNLRDAFGDRLYVILARHRREEEVVDESEWRERARRFGVPWIAANEVLYHTRARRRLQDVLTAIRHGIPVASCGRRLKPNAEYALKPPYAFTKLFDDDPAAVARTLEIAERCSFSLSEIRYRYPSEQLPDGTTSVQWLRQQTFNGARRRFEGEIPSEMKSSRSSIIPVTFLPCGKSSSFAALTTSSVRDAVRQRILSFVTVSALLPSIRKASDYCSSALFPRNAPNRRTSISISNTTDARR
jgi:error-prone DNA polymerase